MLCGASLRVHCATRWRAPVRVRRRQQSARQTSCGLKVCAQAIHTRRVGSRSAFTPAWRPFPAQRRGMIAQERRAVRFSAEYTRKRSRMPRRRVSRARAWHGASARVCFPRSPQNENTALTRKEPEDTRGAHGQEAARSGESARRADDGEGPEPWSSAQHHARKAGRQISCRRLACPICVSRSSRCLRSRLVRANKLRWAPACFQGSAALASGWAGERVPCQQSAASARRSAWLRRPARAPTRAR